MTLNGIRENKWNRIAALCLLFLTLVSCGKTGSPDGREIRFSAKSEPSLTKTSYSGDYEGYRRERIDWKKFDLVRILGYKSEEYQYGVDYSCDYKIINVIPGGMVSYGYLTPLSGPGLRWDDDESEYQFFCVYPSPATPGMSENVYINTDLYGTAGKVVLYMPETQSMTSWEDSGSSIIGSPDMRFAYMVAGIRTGYCASVELDFSVLFTAFQFQITAETSVHLSSFTLSSASSVLADEYDCVFDGHDGNNIHPNSSIAKEITVPLTLEGTPDGTPIEVSAKCTLDFTVFTIPEKLLDDLTISFTGQEFGTRSLDLKFDGEFYQFTPYEKYRIYGLTFPTRSRSQVELGTKSPIQVGSPVDPLEDGVKMRDGEICLNMADEKFNHEWY